MSKKPQKKPVSYDLASQKRVYQRWAPVYDHIYDKLLGPSQRRLAAAASRPGRSILEVGVGTGLVLPYYSAETKVVGVDLSEAMLREAQLKIAKRRLGHVAGVAVMDACRLGFASECFDVVTFPYVITLVPDPEGALEEGARVLRKGGEIIVLSRFGSEDGVQAKVEGAIAPFMKLIGWSSAFKLSRVLNWAGKRGDFDVVDVKKGAYFTQARLKKRG